MATMGRRTHKNAWVIASAGEPVNRFDSQDYRLK